MKINPEFTLPERLNAIVAMDLAMDYLFNNFIKSKMNEENTDMIVTISAIFRDMAEKAEAYHQIQEKSYQDTKNFLN